MKNNGLYLVNSPKPEPKSPLDTAKGIMRAAGISILIWTAIILLCSCNPYPRLTKPARMGYAVDGILCRTYEVDKDTIRLFDAGYWAFKRVQKRGTEITIVNDHVIVKMK